MKPATLMVHAGQTYEDHRGREKYSVRLWANCSVVKCKEGTTHDKHDDDGFYIYKYNL